MLYDDKSRWAGATERVLSQAWAGHDAFSTAVEAADGARMLAGEALTDAPTATTVRKDGFTATPVVTAAHKLRCSRQAVQEAGAGFRTATTASRTRRG